jgi:hypothetical protein
MQTEMAIVVARKSCSSSLRVRKTLEDSARNMDDFYLFSICNFVPDKYNDVHCPHPTPPSHFPNPLPCHTQQLTHHSGNPPTTPSHNRSTSQSPPRNLTSSASPSTTPTISPPQAACLLSKFTGHVKSVLNKACVNTTAYTLSRVFKKPI